MHSTVYDCTNMHIELEAVGDRRTDRKDAKCDLHDDRITHSVHFYAKNST